MSHVITKRSRLSRRTLLKGLSLSHAPVLIGLPPLISMFNSTGTAYAAETVSLAARRAGPSKSALCFGSTATGFRNAIGFRTAPAPTTT